MFYIKNDDMEDMFKKAADNYDLNEEMAADWNKVCDALQDENAFIAPAKEKKRRKIYLLWFLLIPAILIVTFKTGFYFPDKKQNEKSTVTKKTTSTLQNKPSAKNKAINRNNTDRDLSENDKNNIAITNKKKTTTNNRTVSVNTLPPLNINDKISQANTGGIASDANAGKEFLNNDALSHKETMANNFNQPANDSLLKNTFDNDQFKNKSTESLNNKTEAAETKALKQKKKTDNYTRQAFAYTGFTGNTDMSFIKFQKTSVPGFGLGITGGYHFKSGISIETGILYDKKSYYTKGEYFDKSKLGYLQYVNLLSADGNCHMWEIPLNFKYDFNTQKKHNWFVTAGLSSYIMDKEFYNFKYEENGAVNEKAYNYYHSSQNWFSLLNVGGGINIKTSNRYFLQAQPYYKIPLSGIGKGSLSLNSAGINISFTRRLH
jgi:outer membrane protein with beta-barrel domain